MAEIDGIRSRIYKALDNIKKYPYDTLNVSEKYWKIYKEEIKNIDGIEQVSIENPIYFKLNDAQYLFDPKNCKELKKELNDSLDKILKSAESLIDTIEELNIKSATTEEEKTLVERNIKLRKLLIRCGRI